MWSMQWHKVYRIMHLKKWSSVNNRFSWIFLYIVCYIIQEIEICHSFQVCISIEGTEGECVIWFDSLPFHWSCFNHFILNRSQHTEISHLNLLLLAVTSSENKKIMKKLDICCFMNNWLHALLTAIWSQVITWKKISENKKELYIY